MICFGKQALMRPCVACSKHTQWSRRHPSLVYLFASTCGLDSWSPNHGRGVQSCLSRRSECGGRSLTSQCQYSWPRCCRTLNTTLLQPRDAGLWCRLTCSQCSSHQGCRSCNRPDWMSTPQETAHPWCCMHAMLQPLLHRDLAHPLAVGNMWPPHVHT